MALSLSLSLKPEPLHPSILPSTSSSLIPSARLQLTSRQLLSFSLSSSSTNDQASPETLQSPTKPNQRRAANTFLIPWQ